MTNETQDAVSLRVVLGSRGGQLRGRRTSAAEDFRPILRRSVKRGRVNLAITPQSVTTPVLQEAR